MPRASWRGFLRLSLVSCPVYLPAICQSWREAAEAGLIRRGFEPSKYDKGNGLQTTWGPRLQCHPRRPHPVLVRRVGGAPEQKYKNFGNATAFSSPGQPAELASIYVQLAAADGSFAIGNIYGSGGGQGQP
jgi:hypothetical protein